MATLAKNLGHTSGKKFDHPSYRDKHAASCASLLVRHNGGKHAATHIWGAVRPAKNGLYCIWWWCFSTYCSNKLAEYTSFRNSSGILRGVPNGSGIVRQRQIPHRKTSSATPTRGGGFTQAEIESLLGACEQVLPVSGDEWTRVLSIRNVCWSGTNRREDGLHRKFAKLYNTRIPTGDPVISVEVRRAKSVRDEIVQKMDLGGDEVGSLDIEDIDQQTQTNSYPYSHSTPFNSNSAGNDTNDATLTSDRPESLSSPGEHPVVRRRDRQNFNSMSSLMELLQFKLTQEHDRRAEEKRERVERQRRLDDENRQRVVREEQRQVERARTEREECRHE